MPPSRSPRPVPTARKGGLRLRRAVVAGAYRDDEYCVFEGGVRVGRIAPLRPRAPTGPQWEWRVSLPLPTPLWCAGRCETLDDARAAFRDAWARFKPTIGAARLRGLRG
jgi:hypothetical protein